MQRIRLAVVLTALAWLTPAARADTGSALGDHTGEGSTAFTGLAQAPEANLFTGSLNTALPIEVPLGRGGMTPNLALQYSSGGGPSSFGYGWDLPLGHIERSSTWGTPRCSGPHTEDFVLVLPTGAADLVRESPTSKYYRPKVEQAWVRAERQETQNRWLVSDRSGRTYTFGDSDAARVGNSTPLYFLSTASDGTCRLTSTWALTSVEDPNGNRMEIAWSKVFNMLFPATVRWGGNAQANIAPIYTVRFLPEWRPDTDRIASQRLGVRARLALRVYGIDVESDLPTPGTIVRSYTLQYRDGDDQGADGYQSMLASVGVTGRPSQHFVYTPSLTGHAAATVPLAKPSGAYPMLRKSNANQDVSQSVLDMNGDGLLDLVRSDDPPASAWSVYFGAVDAAGTFGFQAAPTAWQAPGNWAFLRNVDIGTGACSGANWSCTRLDTFDLTGDGIPDFVDAGSPSSWTVYPGRAAPQWGFGPGIAWPAPNRAYIRRSNKGDTYQDVVDINGDGLGDLVASGSPGQAGPYNWSVYLNTGAGFETTPLPKFPAPVNTLVDHVGGGVVQELVDFNGDGLPDIVRNSAAGSEAVTDPRCQPSPTALATCLEVYLNTGQGFAEMEAPIPVPPSSMLQSADIDGADTEVSQDFFDVNGDGLPDWLYRRFDWTSNSYQPEWRVLLNLGGTLEPLVFVQATVTPIYTEGIPARVWPGGAGFFRSTSNAHTRSDLVDVNGDGLLDQVMAGSEAWSVRLHAAREHPNLLGLMENGLGGTNTVLYRPSTAFDNSGGDAQPDLPFIQWVAAKTRQNDGLCTPPPGADLYTPGAAPAANPCIDAGHDLVTTYAYADGRFDAAPREFRGFRRVVRAASEGSGAPANLTATVFAQDELVKGRVLSVSTYAGTNATVRTETNLWGTRPAGVGRSQIWLAEQRRSTADAAAGVPLYRSTISDPPDAYGNIVHHHQEGLFGAQRVDTYTTYAVPQSGSTVADKAANVRIEDSTGVLDEKWFYYDSGANGLGLGKVSKGNLKRVRRRRSPSDANGPEAKMAYDGAGNLRSATDASGNVTTTTYDAALLYPIRITNELDQVTSTQFDYRWGQPTRIADSNGAATSFAYDAAGRLTCVARPGDSPDNCSVATSYHFAVAPALSWVERAERQDAPHPPLWTRQYSDALGRARYTDALRVVNGATTTVRNNETDYDAAGRVARVAHPYVAGGPSNGATTFDYRLNGGAANDPLGRVHVTTASDGTRRTTTYSGASNTTEDEEGQRTETAVDSQGRTVEQRNYTGGSLVSALAQGYDGLGRLLEVRQNDVMLKHFEYDSLGRKVAMLDQDSGSWRYGYDGVGNLIWQDDPKQNQHVEICYDALQRPTRRCTYGSDFTSSATCRSTCADAEAVRYTYDAPGVANSVGRLTRIDDASGSTEITAYDVRGHVASRLKTIVVDGRAMHARFAYAYDTNDRLSAVTYPDNEVVRTEYDDAGQPIALYNTANGFYVTDALYDVFGRTTVIQHANGVVDSRTYGGPATQHRLSALRSVGPTGALLDLTYPQYTPRGLLRVVADQRNPNGSLTDSATYTYDGLGRLLVADSPENPLDRTFAYDGMGNLTRNGDRMLSYANVAKPHQVTQVSSASGVVSIAHDSNGNRLGKQGQNYLYDTGDRLKRIDAGADTVRFVHDAAGQLVAKIVETPVLSTSRFYDPRIEVRNGWTTKWYFFGNQRVASITTPYSTWQVAALSDGSMFAAAPLSRPALIVALGSQARWMVAAVLLSFCTALVALPGRRRAAVVGMRVRPSHAIAVALLCAVGTLPWPLVVGPTPAWAGGGGGGNTLLHHHLDHLGSTQAITGAGGALVEQIRYTPYGAVRGRWTGEAVPKASSATGQPRDFAGYQSEAMSGLTSAGARFYDPELGSFLTQDPRAQFTSPYSYGGGDPTNWSDPNGEFFLELLAIIGVSVAVSAAVSTIIAAAQGMPLSAIGKAAIGGAIAGAVGVGIGVIGSGATIGIAALAGTLPSNVTLSQSLSALTEVAVRSAFSTTFANAAGETLNAVGAPGPLAQIGAIAAGYAGSFVFDQQLLAQSAGSQAVGGGVQTASNAATHQDITGRAAEGAGFTPAQTDALVSANLGQDAHVLDNQTHFDFLAKAEFNRFHDQALNALADGNASRGGFIDAVGRASHHLQDQYALGHMMPGTSSLSGKYGAVLRGLIHQTVGGEVTFRQASFGATQKFFESMHGLHYS
ncbi:MAG: toxin TcdB middle/N-terminal domain-containing protein [bacterium]